MRPFGLGDLEAALLWQAIWFFSGVVVGVGLAVLIL